MLTEGSGSSGDRTRRRSPSPQPGHRAKLGPSWAGPAGSRVKAVAQQDRPDRRRGDPDLQLHQLPADPLVTPPRVLPAEADDEVPDLGLDRRPARVTPPPICPLLPDEFAMPAEQGLRPHHQPQPDTPFHP